MTYTIEQLEQMTIAQLLALAADIEERLNEMDSE